MKRLTTEEAVSILCENGTVALPTETVYGLAARADSEAAVLGIFAAKGRPASNPLICHVSSVSMLERYAVIEEADRPLFAFWPGPLTVLLKKRQGIPDVVTAGSPLCAFRIPDHRIFLRVIEAVGAPLAAPSANRSGRTSPVTAEMVEASLEGRIAGVVDGGPCRIGLESTVVRRMPEGCIEILRPGGITAQTLEAAGFRLCPSTRHDAPGAPSDSGGEADVPGRPGEQRGLLSPGMLPVHYAPSIPLLLFETTPEVGLQRLARAMHNTHAFFDREARILYRSSPEAEANLKRLFERPHRLSLLVFRSVSDKEEGPLRELRELGISVMEPAAPGDVEGFARCLYSSFEAASAPNPGGPGPEALISFILPGGGFATAINDRLRRACSLRMAFND